MALINCPECSKSISDQSISCPSCGFPTTRAVPLPLQQVDYGNSLADNRQRQKNSGCAGATIFLIIIIMAIGYRLLAIGL